MSVCLASCRYTPPTEHVAVTAVCTLEAPHPYDHYDEVLNYQWEQVTADAEA